MKFLQSLLVLTGVTAAFTGLFLIVVDKDEAGCKFPCEEGVALSDILGSAIWFTIALVLWALAGVLAWMQKRFDQIQI